MRELESVAGTLVPIVEQVLGKAFRSPVLVLGELAADVAGRWPHARDVGIAAPSGRHAGRIDWRSALDGCERHDAALLSDVVGRLPRDDAASVIARVRDLHARRLCLLVDEQVTQGATPLDGNELRALGLRVLPAVQGLPRVYGFDMASYKATPDWLNARHWAHPELFDRHRW